MQGEAEFLGGVFFALIAVYLLVWAAGAIATMLLHRQLRSRHTEIWADIGGSVFSQSVGKSFRFFKFLFSSQHASLDDKRLSTLVIVARALFVGTVVMLLALSLVIVLMQGTAGPSAPAEPLRMEADGGTPSNVTQGVPEGFYPIAALVIVYLAIVHFFMRHLRLNHQETWKELGSPSLFLNNTPMNSLRVAGFLLTGRHRELGDPKLSRYVYVIRLMLALFLCIFLVPAMLAIS
jgi:hypothetical protein